MPLSTTTVDGTEGASRESHEVGLNLIGFRRFGPHGIRFLGFEFRPERSPGERDRDDTRVGLQAFSRFRSRDSAARTACLPIRDEIVLQRNRTEVIRVVRASPISRFPT